METSETQGSYVPCGRCYSCIMTKRSVWTFRILMELRDAESAYFVTLTYDPESVPLVKQKYGGFAPSLKSEELTKFFKKLRQDIKLEYESKPTEEKRRWLKQSEKTKKWSPKLRYFAVGEYGTKWTKRPHYHIILYNCPNEYFEKDPWNKIYSERLEKIWSKGLVDIGKVEHGSAHYMTKYHMHPLTEKWSEHDQRQKPFTRMSRKPGIGANYITDETRNYYRNSKNYCATLKNGIRQPLGRYYKEKILQEIDEYRDIQIKIANQIREAEEKQRNKAKTESDYFKSQRDRYTYFGKKGIRMLKKNDKI